MIILIDGIKYRLITPENEAALEMAIQSNCEHIFGPDSFYFDKKKMIKSRAGVASIPDSYVIFFDPTPKWCILEVELASHPIYDHLIPQLTKFNRGIEDSSTRKKLVELFYSTFNEDELLKARLKQQIKTGEIYKFLSDLISEQPLIVIAIDQHTDELLEALRDIRGQVRILEFRIFHREGISDQINAYAFNPIVSMGKTVKHSVDIDNATSTIGGETIKEAIYALFREKGVGNVTYEECNNLVKKIMPTAEFGKYHLAGYRSKFVAENLSLTVGLKLHNRYKDRDFFAEVVVGGRIKFNGKLFDSLSGAAVAAIQSTGSSRGTESGPRWWKFTDPHTGKEKPVMTLLKKPL